VQELTLLLMLVSVMRTVKTSLAPLPRSFIAQKIKVGATRSDVSDERLFLSAAGRGSAGVSRGDVADATCSRYRA